MECDITFEKPVSHCPGCHTHLDVRKLAAITIVAGG